MNYSIREIAKEEYHVLEDFLYEAIFIPVGVEAPPRSIIEEPALQVYLSDFGKETDDCLVAVVDGSIVGAVWTRIMDDFGHIDAKTPSFAISVYREYRGAGIGMELMRRMLERLKEKGYQQASLSVQKANAAVRLYKKVGFEVIRETEDEYIMVCQLSMWHGI